MSLNFFPVSYMNPYQSRMLKPKQKPYLFFEISTVFVGFDFHLWKTFQENFKRFVTVEVLREVWGIQKLQYKLRTERRT